jgi:aspartate kinase
MSIIVLKFGGKTIATAEKRTTAAKRVDDCLKKGKKVVVVVSAISDETDKLIELAAEVDGCGYKRELDHLLFTGEVKAAALFSMILLNMGIKARSLNFTNLGIKTNNVHSNAKVSAVDPKNIISILEEGMVPVVPGYQGINETGDVTTLGRGGSDITAVAISAALKAEACVLFKDVGAIFEDDPKVNVNVHKYDKISYDDLYDIANKGCKVVCKESIEIARDNDVVISVANPDNFDIGTVIYKN